ncbi:Rieske 2Fe-2S domain-containing protein [Sphingosinicella terrae]|uniref:Rieske 2Fe-2S domain-containing protein n=1 Tax=Sphingosinicella terrae TaxID=2172047 RepID=UPI000E0DEC0C|nr:Rieske 2Fe-2S domain-containing protein [Sphingosinicella terrae]
MATQPLVDPELLAAKKSWKEYFAAKLGFRNHWYVACFSREIAEGEVLARKIMGEGILLRRINGKVHAIRDRCIHRGVKLSDKVECHNAETITCWYHGFTFRWEDGLVTAIVGAPESSAVGTKRIKTYPVEEAKGLVFVFVGDADFAAPPLRHECPPSFLDDAVVVEGDCRVVKSNWRLGPEGGIDEIHRYLHREAPLLLNTKSSLPLGHKAVRGQFEMVEDEDGPKGLIDHFKAEKMYFDAQLDEKTVVRGVNFGAEGRRAVYASVWLPACLKVEGFPGPGLTLFEWYVPIDETSHRCFMTIGSACATDEEADLFRQAYKARWKPLAVDGFLQQDIMARESAQGFYGNDRAWLEECLVEDDFMLIEWRKLRARHCHGIQTLDHLL